MGQCGKFVSDTGHTWLEKKEKKDVFLCILPWSYVILDKNFWEERLWWETDSDTTSVPLRYFMKLCLVIIFSCGSIQMTFAYIDARLSCFSNLWAALGSQKKDWGKFSCRFRNTHIRKMLLLKMMIIKHGRTEKFLRKEDSVSDWTWLYLM
jgi:hypothetical protein